MSRLIDCPDCGKKGGLWTKGCIGCLAKKIIYLRSPDGSTSLKMQKAALAGFSKTDQEKALSMVKSIGSTRTP